MQRRKIAFTICLGLAVMLVSSAALAQSGKRTARMSSSTSCGELNSAEVRQTTAGQINCSSPPVRTTI